jgi:hypothetical protein
MNVITTKTTLASLLLCLAIGPAAAVQAAEPTLEENRAAARQKHVVPGKVVHLTGTRGYRFAEVALITGTTKENAIAEFYNSTGVDDPTPERFAKLNADQLAKETGSMSIFLNPPRHWMHDEFWCYEAGNERTFGDIKMTWMGVVGVQEMEAGVAKGKYIPGYIFRNSQYKYNKGSEVYLLDAPNGDVFIMQSFTDVADKTLTKNNLKDLGKKLKLPPGFKSRSVVLDRDLIVNQKKANNLAAVFQDDLNNTYQGSVTAARPSVLFRSLST